MDDAVHTLTVLVHINSITFQMVLICSYHRVSKVIENGCLYKELHASSVVMFGVRKGHESA